MIWWDEKAYLNLIPNLTPEKIRILCFKSLGLEFPWILNISGFYWPSVQCAEVADPPEFSYFVFHLSLSPLLLLPLLHVSFIKRYWFFNRCFLVLFCVSLLFFFTFLCVSSTLLCYISVLWIEKWRWNIDDHHINPNINDRNNLIGQSTSVFHPFFAFLCFSVLTLLPCYPVFHLLSIIGTSGVEDPAEFSRLVRLLLPPALTLTNHQQSHLQHRHKIKIMENCPIVLAPNCPLPLFYTLYTYVYKV